MVLIKDDKFSPCQWPLEPNIKCYAGQDKVVHVVAKQFVNVPLTVSVCHLLILFLLIL